MPPRFLLARRQLPQIQFRKLALELPGTTFLIEAIRQIFDPVGLPSGRL
jgi:hypothetical protein